MCRSESVASEYPSIQMQRIQMRIFDLSILMRKEINACQLS